MLFLASQENLWRPVVKEPVENSDGSVQVFYEVPAGNNERLELSKKVTPQVCRFAYRCDCEQCCF